MTSHFKNIALAAVVAVAAPAAVSAASITLSQNGTNTYGTVDLSGSDIPGFNGRTNQLAGGFNVTDGVTEFTAWCVELTEYLRLAPKHSGAYDDEIMPTTISDTITDNLSRLFTGFLSKVSATDSDQQAAFQVAIWEIVYDDGLDLTSGDFQMADASGSAGIQALATSYLTGLSSYAKSYDMSYFSGDNTQDLVTGTPNGGSLNPIPLPAAGLLLLAGLGGLGMVGRRKRA